MSDPETNPRPLRRSARLAWVACGLLAVAVSTGAWLRLTRPAAPPSSAPTAPTATLRITVLADGQPVDGARVTAIAGNRLRRSARVEGNGQASLQACPRGAITLLVEAAGYARVVRLIDTSAGDADAEFTLQPGAALRGRIHDESDRPLAGASIVVRVLGASPQGPQEPWAATSNVEGSFVIDTLPRTHVTLEVSDGGAHESAVIAELVLPNDTPVDVVLRRTAAVAGRVSSSASGPASGARVTLAGSGVWPARHAETNAQGEFKFERVPEGIYEVRAEKGDSVSAPLEGVSVGPGNDAHVDLALIAGVTLRGLTRDVATGRVVSGAELEVVEESLSATSKHVRTAGDGHFEVAGLRALAHRVVARAAGYVTDQRWVTPGATPLSIDLLRAVSVSGRVEDADGRPVPLADLEVNGRSTTGYAIHMLGPINEAADTQEASAVNAEPSGANLGVTRGNVPRIPLGPQASPSNDTALVGDGGFHSNEHGDFRLEGLPPGELVLAARKPGFGAGRSRALQADPAAQMTDVVIVLPLGAALTGRVLDGHGVPVPHVRVDLSAPSDPARSTVSGDDGSFRFEAARGPCTLQARAVGRPVAHAEVSASEVGRRDVDLVLESATDRLTGRVLDNRERPIESASIQLETGKGRAFSATALSSADGTFEFSALPAPPYVVQVEHPDYTPSGPLAVNVSAQPLVVRLSAGADLSGVVVGAGDGGPIAGARVTVGAAGQTRTAHTGREGTFEFRHLSSGDYKLSVEADHFIPERRQGGLEATASGQGPFERIVLAPAGSVSGDVVDRIGATVWNAEVATGAPPDWSHTARSDHAGHFQLMGLAAGDHVLVARRGTLQVAGDRPVRVYAGQDTPGQVLRLQAVVESTEDTPADQPSSAADGSAMRRSSAAEPPLAFVGRGGAVLIERVSPGEAGARSGLQVGDVLVSVDGEPVRSAAQARGMLAPVLGHSILRSLDVRRAGQPLHLSYAIRK